MGAGRTTKVYKTRIAQSANPERVRETISSAPAPTRLDDECRVLPQFANLVLWSSIRETTSSASAASPAPPAPTSRFSRLRREPSTRATRAQIRAIFDVPHEPLPLKTVVGGGAFGTVYLVETSMGRIAVKQVRRWRANCGRSTSDIDVCTGARVKSLHESRTRDVPAARNWATSEYSRDQGVLVLRRDAHHV